MTALAWIASQACQATVDCPRKAFFTCAACDAPICKTHEDVGLCPGCLIQCDRCMGCGAILDGEREEPWCSTACMDRSQREQEAEWAQEERR